MKFKLILPISEVDAGETVTKPGGEQEFTVSDNVTIYTQSSTGPPEKIKYEGMRFMCGDSINAVPLDTPVAFHFDSWEALREFVGYQEQ